MKAYIICRCCEVYAPRIRAISKEFRRRHAKCRVLLSPEKKDWHRYHPLEQIEVPAIQVADSVPSWFRQEFPATELLALMAKER